MPISEIPGGEAPPDAPPPQPTPFAPGPTPAVNPLLPQLTTFTDPALSPTAYTPLVVLTPRYTKAEG